MRYAYENETYERVRRPRKKPEGRPRKLNYDEVIKFKGSGLSILEIAQKFKCSRGAIQYAMGLPYATRGKRREKYST